MTSEENKYRLLDSFISENTSFAIYRLPGKNKIYFISNPSNSIIILNNFQDLKEEKGFVIAPFQITQNTPVIIIHPEIVIEGEEKILEYLSNKSFHGIKNGQSDIEDLNEADNLKWYSSKFELFHHAVESDDVKKLVLSRRSDIKKSPGFSAGLSFRNACEKYPSNFIYLTHTPYSGTWFGCSPESLVSGKGNQWKTDALAGTQKWELRNQEEIVWDDKNRLEQGIVAEYMNNQLNKIGIKSFCSEPKTVRSGDLVHLRSELQFEMDKKQIGKLLELLHPSPAVCGFPKEKAFDFILNNEGYNREYYSGFVGYLDTDTKTDLFVNLRCMRIYNDYMRLYAGGGILPSSELMSEWLETEHKLQTILSILNT